MVKTKFLGQEQRDEIERVKSRKQFIEEEKTLRRARKEQKELDRPFRKEMSLKSKKVISTFATGGRYSDRRKEFPKRIAIPSPTKEQAMLQEMFSGNDNYGTGRNLPKIDGLLIKGGGLIKSRDRKRETAGLFGL